MTTWETGSAQRGGNLESRKKKRRRRVREDGSDDITARMKRTVGPVVSLRPKNYTQIRYASTMEEHGKKGGSGKIEGGWSTEEPLYLMLVPGSWDYGRMEH